MQNLGYALIFWGLAALFAWSVYSRLFNYKDRVLIYKNVAYRKGKGVIAEKQVTQAQYILKFTYPEESNVYYNVIPVSRKQFDKARIGDKIPIYYGLHLPHIWMSAKSGLVYYASIIVSIITIAIAVIFFLIGWFILTGRIL